MFLKIATTVTLIASCFSHEPAYDERASNEAISTHSFNRDDIPISYKYTAIHVYSTQKPIDEDDVIRPRKHQNQEHHVVQYAPLVENTTKKSSSFTKVISDSNNIAKKSNDDIKNKNLEPRKHPARVSNVTKMKYFVPGHNIEVRRSPNRNLGYNAIYQSEPRNLKGTQNKINNNLEDYVRQDQDFIPRNGVTKSPKTFNYLKQEPFAWMAKRNQKPDAYMFYKGATNLQSNHLNPAPSHHTHRMQINVARMNGLAQVIAKKIVIGDILNNLGKPQGHANLKGIQGLDEEQRTLLYPKRKQLYQKSI